MSGHTPPTADQLEQASLTVVAMLTAVRHGMSAPEIWDGLDPADQRGVALTMVGHLYGGLVARAAMYGVTVDMALEQMAVAAVETVRREA